MMTIEYMIKIISFFKYTYILEGRGEKRSKGKKLSLSLSLSLSLYLMVVGRTVWVGHEGHRGKPHPLACHLHRPPW